MGHTLGVLYLSGATKVNVTEATQRRASIRSFLPDHVTDEQIRELLEVASRAPSG
ncbi:MAG TPA: hypothetical protein DCX77_05080, partial [Acidimicrobiaceae bacterium]|nr:hypothetical protein [Acidimicrobiaceae bacterium]